MNLTTLFCFFLVLAICANQARCSYSYSIATQGSPAGIPNIYFCSISNPSVGCLTWQGGATYYNVTTSSFELGLLYSNKDQSGSYYFDRWSFDTNDNSLTYYLSTGTPETCAIQGFTTGQISYTCPGAKVVIDATVKYW